jgi:glycine/D-amino acid oxidase-like deaminating enzyme/nitrite reductase/ring-hydroxylating ferredoxin subunit
MIPADATADVCIIGAGIAGLSVAYALVRAGRSVVVLDDGPVGGGMTARTTAHLTNALDDRYVEIERIHGESGARIAAESHTAAIDRIEANAAAEGIDCEFERLDGYLFAASDGDVELLDRELASAQRAGVAGVERVGAAPLANLRRPALRFPRQAQFHPLEYLTGLAAAIERAGGKLYGDTHVSALEDGTTICVRTTDDNAVTAAAAVVATNAPINDRVAIHTKQAPYTTYVIAARVPKGAVGRALYWDTADPYHYVRLVQGAAAADGAERLLVGGEDHKAAQADDGAERFARLEGWMREHFAAAGAVELHWSGQVLEPVDGIAFIGRNPGSDNVYVASGDSGMGMTHGTIAGSLISDLILGQPSPWAELYDPARKIHRSAANYAKENLNVAAQYLKGYVGGGDVGSADEIAAGAGAVLRRNLGKVAVYRDDTGALHEYSAVCPHLGCIVRWNAVELTWDCPCHGSKFDCHGHVVVGPANADLEALAGGRSAG